jgi:hypothetical protein
VLRLNFRCFTARLAVLATAVIALVLASRPASAATCTWKSTDDSSWDDTTDWANCGGGYPSTGDTAVFDGTGNGECNLDLNITVANITIGNFTGGIVSNPTKSLTVTSNYTQTNGTFNANSASYPLTALTVNGTFTISGGTFNAPATVTLTGAFTQSNGTFNGSTALIKMGDANFNGGTFHAPSSLFISGAFARTAGTFDAGSGSSFITLNATSSKSHTPTSATFNHLNISDSLVGYWKLDEAAAATTATDYSGYGNTMSKSSGKTALTGATTLFKNDYGVTFAKTDPLHVTAATTTFQNLNWSISAWVKITDIGGGGGTDTCGDGVSGSEGAEVVNVGNDYALRLCAQDSTAGTATYLRAFKHYASGWEDCSTNGTVTFAMDNASWHHVAATFDGSTINTYLDGTKVACTGKHAQDFNGSKVVAIGGHTGLTSYELGGSIDDVRVYNTALTQTQVMLLYGGAQPVVSQVTHTMGATLDVNGTFNIASGTVTGSSSVNVAGSWLNHGGAYTGTGTVTFDGSSGGSILSNYQRFGALTVNGSGTWSMLDRLWVDGLVTLSAGTLATNNYFAHLANITKASGAGAAFTPGSGTVVFDGSIGRILTFDSNSSLNTIRVEDPTETGLVGYWKFDSANGPTVRDSSGSNSGAGYSGTLLPTTYPPLGRFGSANVSSRFTKFDNHGSINFAGAGYDQRISFTASTAHEPISVSAWIYIPTSPASQGSPRIVDLPHFRFYHTSGRKLGASSDRSAGTDGDWQTNGTTGLVGLDGWHHVVVTYDGSTLTNDPVFYIDGSSALGALSSDTNPTMAAYNSATSTGYIGNSAALTDDFAGSIDDLRIYNVVLSSTEVTALYNGGYPLRGGTASVSVQSNTTITSSNNDSGSAQVVYRAYEDQGGTIEGYPAAAFDWSNYNYHATYVAYNGVSSKGRIYKRDTTGAALGYFELATNRSFIGSPKWTHDGVANSAVYFIYAIDDQGTVYKLNDASFTGSGGSAVATYRNGAGATATSPLAADTTNLYWTGLAADGSTASVFRLQQANMTTVSSQSTTTVEGAVPALATVVSSDYVFYANSTKLYKVAVSPSLGTPSLSSWAPSAAVYGRVTVPYGVAYFIDYAGKLFGANPSDLTASPWTYQDTASSGHSGACSSGSACAAKNLFVNYGMGGVNGNVFWGDRDGHVYSINTSTHAALTGYPWRPGTSSDIYETAPLYRAGILAVGTTAGKVYFTDHRTVTAGTPALISTFDFCTTSTCTSSAVGSISYDFDGGQYMIGTADGKMYYVNAITDPTNSDN